MMNNHNYSNTSKQIAQSSGAVTTTDAVIIQSNSNVVTDEFLQQLQEQFGGENKQIYILNTNNSGTSLTSVNTDSSSASLSSSNTNSQIQYLIVDKDVDINLILQDPSIFNNQQQQQPIEQPVKQTQPKFATNNRFSNNQPTNTTTAQTTTTNTTNGLNQMLAVEESIQRVQVPPPKRKQFELKLENKKNSYQDVFLRYLAGEKQPTLEIMQSEYAHSANKKPKDNLNYQTNSKIASNSTITTPIGGSSKIVIPTLPAVANQIIANQSQTVNLDKENYYNSSRRENLLPLNNYEYRNSYKDHYDNQGVRVNPAVLKNLSYSGATSGTTPVNSSPSNNTIINRAVNLPTKKLNDNIASVLVVNSNQAKSPINVPKTNQEIFNYSNGLSTSNDLNDLKSKNDMNSSVKLNDLVQSAALSTTTKSNLMNNDPSHVAILNEHLQQQQIVSSNIIDETVDTNVIESQMNDDLSEEITFSPGEFLIHKSTFSGDFDNYDIWCVRDDGYLQKYEPVLLATGERCHQSADVLAQYTADKTEFVLVKVDEKGKTEQDNIVVGVLNNYEPKNRKIFNPQLQTVSTTSIASTSAVPSSSSSVVASTTPSLPSTSQSTATTVPSNTNNVLVVTYDDLKATLDVFLQALLSQNLNSEFLIKLKEIQDEYFKPSIEFIDSILNEKYVSLMSNLSQFITMSDKKGSNKQKQQLVQFESLFKYLVETKPKLISQILQAESRCRCQGIVFLNNELLYDDQFTAQYVVKFAGHSYSQDNLLPVDTNTNSSNLDKDSMNKEFYVCAKTLQFAQLCHTVKHLKINFYEICQQKIEIVKQISSNSGAPEILNDCLADSQWLMEMFEKFKQLLFEIDNLITMTQNDTATEITDTNAQHESQALINHHLVVDQVTNNLIDDIQLNQ